jgi:hypothetical protein
VKASALVSFVTSGVLGVFFLLARPILVFAFDAPSKGFLHEVARWSLVLSVWGYPVLWCAAFILTIVGVLRDWEAKYLIALAVFPFLIAAAPFFIGILASRL